MRYDFQMFLVDISETTWIFKMLKHYVRNRLREPRRMSYVSSWFDKKKNVIRLFLKFLASRFRPHKFSTTRTSNRHLKITQVDHTIPMFWKYCEKSYVDDTYPKNMFGHVSLGHPNGFQNFRGGVNACFPPFF